MSRIAIPAIESATGYVQIKKIAAGRVPNTYAAVDHLAPAPLATALNTQGALASHIQISPRESSV